MTEVKLNIDNFAIKIINYNYPNNTLLMHKKCDFGICINGLWSYSFDPICRCGARIPKKVINRYNLIRRYLGYPCIKFSQ